MSKIDPEVAEQIRGLPDRPSFQLLVAEMERRASEEAQTLGRKILASKDPVDQRHLDERRGFWLGAMYALKTYPKQADQTWQRHVAEALKESETSGS